MTFIKSTLAAVAMIFAVGSTGAIAAEATATDKPAVTKPVKAAKVKKAKPTKTAEEKAAQAAKSKACSAEADKQKLHGKPRKEFRKTCMKKPA